MGLNRDNLVLFHKPWFSGSPVNATKASKVLTFTGVGVATETVTIGTEVYEFLAPAGTPAVVGNVGVYMAATPTADDSVTKLTAAINANSALATAVGNTTADTVTITAKLVGTEGNSILIAENCTNASFAGGAVLLSGGRYATPCKASSALIEISGTKYYTEKPVDKWSETGWQTISLS